MGKFSRILSFSASAAVQKRVSVCVLKKRKTVSAAAFVGLAAQRVGPSKLNESKLLITESRSTVLPLKKCFPVTTLKNDKYLCLYR